MLGLILCVLVNLFIVVLSQSGYNTQGEGIWSTIDVNACGVDIEDEIMKLQVEKHRINSTHEVFLVDLVAETVIDDTFGLFIEVCKHVDGGCKRYMNFVDGMEKLLNKHAKSNLEKALQMAGIDPPNFPIPEGHHVVENFLMDYCALPLQGPYGKYEATAFFMKDDKRVGCVMATVEFSQPEDDTCS